MRELIDFLSGFMTDERNSAFDRVLMNRTRYISVVLEDIYQAHNASAVLRTCDCFGIQDVHIIEKRNRYRISKDVALGAEKWLTINNYHGLTNPTKTVYEQLRKSGYRIVATTPHEGDTSLENFDPGRGKFALVFGTELKGLSDEAVSGADEFLRIPMFGFTESFNISVSAAIILHYLTKKLHDSDIEWRMDEDEINELKIRWLRTSIKSSELLEKQFYARKGTGN